MKPTIGRIVCYHTTKEDRERMDRRDECNVQEELPAMIVAVWNGNCVNLKVMLDGVGDLWITSSLQGDNEGEWNWFEIKL